MILAIDAGNTRIKWGVHDGHAWSAQGAIATADAARLYESVRDALPVDAAIASNVAGPGIQAEIERVCDRADIALTLIRSQPQQLGVANGYRDPSQLGADRWAALIAARRLCPGPCAVVNAGTTMTVDALSAEGVFLGGFIVPGIELMRDALSRDTAQLKSQGGSFSFFPDNTGDAIVSGALNALAGAIDRMARYVVETGEDDPVVILSGGNAALLAPRMSGRPQLVDNLVLEGLAVIGASDV